MTYDYDLLVIGAGSGGVRAARMAAQTGARVAIAEERYLGGTCVNVGCVPKKLMVYASTMQDVFEEAGGFGWMVGSRDFDWLTFRANKNREIARLNGIYGDLLDKAGVTRMDGHARIVEPNTLDVDGKTVTARTILIATGSWPRMPDIPGIKHAVTSNEAFHFDELPHRLLVLGGGYIAVEFAGIYHGFGSAVTLAYRGEPILRGFDDDLRSALSQEMTARGIAIRYNLVVTEIRRDLDAKVAVFSDGSEQTFDEIIFAIGRVPLADDLGLENVGIARNRAGAIPVDAVSKTQAEDIYAIGDVTDRMNLTPVAIAEAMAFVKTVFEDAPTEPDYDKVPTAVFSRPPIGTVGLTEAEARERGHAVRIYRSRFRPLKHTLSGSDERALYKLVVDDDTDRVLGLHILGPDAGEITQGFAVAIKMGATKADFDATIAIHPTSAEELVTMREPV